MAKELDNTLFDKMHIRPLWIEEFADIPKLLRRIGKKPRTSSKKATRRTAPATRKRAAKKGGKDRASASGVDSAAKKH